MSLISFLKDAGEKLFGHKDDAPAAAPAPTQAAAPAAPDPAAQKASLDAANSKAAQAIKTYIGTQNLAAAGLDVKFDGTTSTVTVSGEAPDQATAEKIVLCCGNVHGVHQVDNKLTVKAAATESRWYTVVKGDTLSGIAKSQLGNANSYMKIFEANRPMLRDPDKIYPGQLLRIPG